MSRATSSRSFDARAIVSMIVVLAGAVGPIGLVRDRTAVDSPQVHPIASAPATSHASGMKKAV
ncbi:MAG: hypothetical protein ABI277_02690 [Burkholderiaceae bacterium]